MAAALTTLVTGCSSSTHDLSSSGTAAVNGIHGDQLSQPVVLADASRSAVFRSSAGGTTTLGELQRGRLMLVYFGYTHCPDVCPTTMADLGQALRQLPTPIQARTQVVFITADPDRDSPAVMRTWLANFDPTLVRRFVGLTADVDEIDDVAKSVGVPLEPPVKDKNGSISVGHGAQTLAFLDDKASVLWLAGTTVGDYAHDIDALVTNGGSS